MCKGEINMKRYVVLVLCLVLCFTLTGCTSPFKVIKNITSSILSSQKVEDTENPVEENDVQNEVEDEIPEPEEQENPYPYSQKILLTASKGSSNATMQLMNYENGDWKTTYTCNATVGKDGIGSNYGEGKSVTPAGIYKLGVILCTTKPANNWPYRIVSSKTCIVDDVNSTLYNTIQDVDSLSSNVHVDRIGNTIINGNSQQCMYIEHNGDGISNEGVVAGKGSAITICGRKTSLTATAGCVDIAALDLRNIISQMNYNNNPHIEIVVK